MLRLFSLYTITFFFYKKNNNKQTDSQKGMSPRNIFYAVIVLFAGDRYIAKEVQAA